ncbi:MAG: phosphoribosylamine--glycine ligase [Aureispira sp.]
MKIAIIGSGGREHALSWKLAQTLGQASVYTLPGNDGIPNSHPMDILDFDAIQQFCEAEEIAYIFVGPEVPLAAGIVDFFKGTAIQALGPSQQAAQLEGSKIFSKNFMKKYGVATAAFHTFSEVSDAEEIVHEMDGDLVIKYDGLAAGKGVFVCDNIQEALDGLDEIREQYGEECSFLIEDKIEGDEVSLIGFTDGQSIRLLLPSQDHKQLLDGDKGPNTGGMGAFCPVPFWNETLAAAIEEKIVAPTLRGIQAEQMDYKGVLYFGVMLGENGPELLEYNVRFGDPETEVLLPALKTDLAEVVKACLESRLGDLTLEFEEGYFVDVVQVSGGYPKKYQKGFPIKGLESAQKDALVFQAGTRLVDGQLCNNGGRVLNIVAQGNTLKAAIDKAYRACEQVHFEGHFYRKDIGQREHKGLYK